MPSRSGFSATNRSSLPSAERRVVAYQELEIFLGLLGAPEPCEHADVERALVDGVGQAREALEHDRQVSAELVESVRG